MTHDQIASLIAVICIIIVAAQLTIARLPATQHAKIAKAEGIITTVVHAVEQAKPQLAGPEKKSYAIFLAETLLKSVGIAIPSNIIEIFIESAVFALNESKPLNTTMIFPPTPLTPQQLAVPVTMTGTTTVTTPAAGIETGQ